MTGLTSSRGSSSGAGSSWSHDPRSMVDASNGRARLCDPLSVPHSARPAVLYQLCAGRCAFEGCCGARMLHKVPQRIRRVSLSSVQQLPRAAPIRLVGSPAPVLAGSPCEHEKIDEATSRVRNTLAPLRTCYTHLCRLASRALGARAQRGARGGRGARRCSLCQCRSSRAVVHTPEEPGASARF